MVADLREKLEKLVVEWREDIKHVLMSAEDYSPKDYAECRAIKGCADKLAAILAESEEPDPFDAWHCPCHSGSVCGEACKRGRHHGGCIAGPRSAHEPLPAPAPAPLPKPKL